MVGSYDLFFLAPSRPGFIKGLQPGRQEAAETSDEKRDGCAT
jgi:hypothetical protein